MLRHCDKEERMQSNHSNKQIDKSRTDDNLQFWGYDEACGRYDARIAELDSVPGANVRKDRVTCFGLCVPMPEGLDGLGDDRQMDWIEGVVRIVERQYGSENLVGLYYHEDEVHAYKDAETGKDRLSRPHLHFYMIPEVKGKLNGKEFSNKRNMMKLNKDIHEMSKTYFGVDFMDGSKRKSKKEVETLKEESRLKELEARERAVQKEHEANIRLRNELEAQKDAINKIYEEMDGIQKKDAKKAYTAFQRMTAYNDRRKREELPTASIDEVVEALAEK